MYGPMVPRPAGINCDMHPLTLQLALLRAVKRSGAGHERARRRAWSRMRSPRCPRLLLGPRARAAAAACSAAAAGPPTLAFTRRRISLSSIACRARARAVR